MVSNTKRTLKRGGSGSYKKTLKGGTKHKAKPAQNKLTDEHKDLLTRYPLTLSGLYRINEAIMKYITMLMDDKKLQKGGTEEPNSQYMAGTKERLSGFAQNRKTSVYSKSVAVNNIYNINPDPDPDPEPEPKLKVNQGEKATVKQLPEQIPQTATVEQLPEQEKATVEQQRATFHSGNPKNPTYASLVFNNTHENPYATLKRQSINDLIVDSKSDNEYTMLNVLYSLAGLFRINLDTDLEIINPSLNIKISELERYKLKNLLTEYKNIKTYLERQFGKTTLLKRSSTI